MPKRICLKRELTWLHQPPPKGSSLWKKKLKLAANALQYFVHLRLQGKKAESLHLYATRTNYTCSVLQRKGILSFFY